MLHIGSLAPCKICIFCTFCAIHSHCPRMQKSSFLCFVLTSRLTSPLRHKKSSLLRTIRVSLSGDIRWRTPAFFSCLYVYLQRSYIVTDAFLGLCRIKELSFRWLNLENWKHSRKAKGRRLEARLRQVTHLFSSSHTVLLSIFWPCLWVFSLLRLQHLGLVSGESRRNGIARNRRHSTDAPSCKNEGQSSFKPRKTSKQINKNSVFRLSACFIYQSYPSCIDHHMGNAGSHNVKAHWASKYFKVFISFPLSDSTEFFTNSRYSGGKGRDACWWTKHVWWRFLLWAVTSFSLPPSLWWDCCLRGWAGPGSLLPDQHTHVSIVFPANVRL